MPDPAPPPQVTGPESMRRPSALGMAALVGVSVFPYVNFLDGNRGEVVPVGRLVLYAAATVVVALGAYGVALRATRVSADRVAVPIAVVVMSFFTFTWWLDPNPVESRRVIQVLLWVGVTAGFAAVLFRLSRMAGLRMWLLLFAALLPIFPAVSYGLYEATSADPEQADDADPVGPGLDDPETRPNVYHFVLDFHARADQLDELVGLDNAEFLAGLEERGFSVADSAVSSYPVTGLSIPSTMDMSYVATSADDLSAGIGAFNDGVRGDSRVVREFEEAGYQFIYSANGTFTSSDCSQVWADLCLPPTTSGASVDDFTQQILGLTPLGSLGLFNQPYTDPVQVVDELNRARPSEPFLLFAHVISPHPPYRFDDDCARRAKTVPRLSLEPAEEQAHYATEVACIDSLMLEAADRIIDEDPDAVIIVQSDHGPEFLSNWYLDLEDWSDEALAERYSVLNAMRLPAGCGPLEQTEALVNTYRVLFACLEGTEPERLDLRAFLFRWEADHDLEEIPVERLDLDGAVVDP